MKKFLSIFILTAAVLLYSCDTATDVTNKVEETADDVKNVIDDHAGHDHSGHDHAAHGDHKELKDHVCTAACKDAGKCVTACGEKGHECSDACHADHKELKDHVCTDACKDAGKCVTTCGEKGHECTDACHAKAQTEHKCSDKCNAGTHKCGDHCGCGDSCACTSEASCSDACTVKS